MPGVAVGLLVNLLQNVAVPEILAWLAARKNPQNPITDQEIADKLGLDIDTANTAGLAFLTQFGPNILNQGTNE